jgi:hypothetical protein
LRISKVIAGVLIMAGERVGEVNAAGDELFKLDEVVSGLDWSRDGYYSP